MDDRMGWLLSGLALLGFEAGFIAPSEGRSFQLLTRLLSFCESKPACDFRYGVFVLTQETFRVGFMAHQLHHWLSYRSGLPGYTDLEQKLYKVFWEKHDGVLEDKIEQMTEQQMVQLKNAINRDLEALRFIREVTNEIFAPANQARQLLTGGAFA
jgi:hypothetical protein